MWLVYPGDSLLRAVEDFPGPQDGAHRWCTLGTHSCGAPTCRANLVFSVDHVATHGDIHTDKMVVEPHEGIQHSSLVWSSGVYRATCWGGVASLQPQVTSTHHVKSIKKCHVRTVKSCTTPTRMIYARLRLRWRGLKLRVWKVDLREVWLSDNVGPGSESVLYNWLKTEWGFKEP